MSFKLSPFKKMSKKTPHGVEKSSKWSAKRLARQNKKIRGKPTESERGCVLGRSPYRVVICLL